MRNHRWFAPAAAAGHYIPENTMVGAFPELLNRNPHRRPEPEQYRPERFSDRQSSRTAQLGTGAFRCRRASSLADSSSASADTCRPIGRRI
ncbi:cytochrome P450 [Nocardia fusca]|uniref:cytochrome P450 n=1 Tax=Nocardia fusca TaxID=941183 RepID=UPI0037CB858D